MNERAADSTSAGPSGLCTAAKVRRLSRQISQIYDEALGRHGLTIGQFGLLACLSRRHGIGMRAISRPVMLVRT